MKPTLWPYKVLAQILYGRQDWISRDSTGRTLVAVGKLATHFNIHNERLKEYLQHLYDVGLLNEYTWCGPFFACRVRCPEGFGIFIKEETISAETQDTITVD